MLFENNKTEKSYFSREEFSDYENDFHDCVLKLVERTSLDQTTKKTDIDLQKAILKFAAKSMLKLA